MPTTHTVAQGETLTRIAKQHNFGSATALYNPPANSDFKKLRADPNLIFPGDKITIPDIDPKQMQARAGQKYTFCIKREVEVYRVKIQNKKGKAWEGKRAVLNLGGETIDTTIGPDGVIELELPESDMSTGALDIYMAPDSETPSHSFEVQLGSLDPVEELSGVQARCNLLGHECGVADGIMGSNTRKGIKSFQAANGLDVDGVPGPMTKDKLKEVYGC